MDFKTWLKGLAVFVVSAFVTSLAATNISPSTFNFTKAGLQRLGVLVLVIGVKAVLLYLKQSPLKIGGQAISAFALATCLLLFPAPGHASKRPLKKHALARVASVAAKPFTATVGHPKRTLKQIAGSVLFAVETGVDGARLGLEGADKAFDAISIQGKVPVLDQIYSFVSVGAKDAAKLDLWLERQEQDLFGTHN